MTDNPKIERPPLEEMRGCVGLDFPSEEIARIINYALALEAELARYKRYREGTRGMQHVYASMMGANYWHGEPDADDIAKEEGIVDPQEPQPPGVGDDD